uniref:Uncharacterized protein n=1 Tax=Chenopodium quinoa TaxID=63459 RepID=A0A803N8J9_CHEQI
MPDSSLSAYRVDETAIQERPIGDSVLVTTNENLPVSSTSGAKLSASAIPVVGDSIVTWLWGGTPTPLSW